MAAGLAKAEEGRTDVDVAGYQIPFDVFGCALLNFLPSEDHCALKAATAFDVPFHPSVAAVEDLSYCCVDCAYNLSVAGVSIDHLNDDALPHCVVLLLPSKK